jgi:large subunit ribosomal protein L31
MTNTELPACGAADVGLCVGSSTQLSTGFVDNRRASMGRGVSDIRTAPTLEHASARRLSGAHAFPIIRDPVLHTSPEAAVMKDAIHPNYKQITVTCSCGNTFETRSTLGQPLQIEVCSSCHPFYTGKQKIVDTGGRVDRFRKKYAAGKA